MRSKSGGGPVDTAHGVPDRLGHQGVPRHDHGHHGRRGKLHWDDRVVDLDPDFQLKDPWVTREFRVFDLLAQRSGLPPYANDMVGMLGGDETAMIRSLRHVEPVSSFRSTFAYTNITHIWPAASSRKLRGAATGTPCCAQELLEPLGMEGHSFTAEAIEAAANHADGHRWTPDGTIEVPFTPIFPYDFGGAGNINSTVEDMARWIRLQLGNGTFEGQRIVSPENLAVTRTPRVGITDRPPTRMGWVVSRRRTAASSGTTAARPPSAPMSACADRDVGIVILTNETNVGLPGCGRRVGVRPAPRQSARSTMSRSRSRRRRRGSRPRTSCSPSRRTRGRFPRSRRSPAISSIRASARRRCG